MPATLLERLRALDTTTLSDASGGSLRVMDPGLRPVGAATRMLGPAVTVSGQDDLMPVREGLSVAGAGDVLVVDTGGAPRAALGELFAHEALRRGLAGVVIDGLCRDAAELTRLPLPVWARGLAPRASPATARPAGRVAIRCGGVAVAPGDLILGDEDGLLVGTPAELEAVLDRADEIQAAERAIRAAIAGGESLFEHVSYEEHLARLRAGEESRLRLRGA